MKIQRSSNRKRSTDSITLPGSGKCGAYRRRGFTPCSLAIEECGARDSVSSQCKDANRQAHAETQTRATPALRHFCRGARKRIGASVFKSKKELVVLAIDFLRQSLVRSGSVGRKRARGFPQKKPSDRPIDAATQ
jgi:hypothetical protein